MVVATAVVVSAPVANMVIVFDPVPSVAAEVDPLVVVAVYMPVAVERLSALLDLEARSEPPLSTPLRKLG